MGIDAGGWPHPVLLCFPEAFSSPGEGDTFVAMPPAAALVPGPSECAGSQRHGLLCIHQPALPGKGGQGIPVGRDPTRPSVGAQKTKEGTLQGSPYFLRTSVPISPAHMICWDILHVLSVSTLLEKCPWWPCDEMCCFTRLLAWPEGTGDGEDRSTLCMSLSRAEMLDLCY